jgi:hypothetical protein
MKKPNCLLLLLILTACGPAVVVTPTIAPSPSSTPAPPTATSTFALTSLTIAKRILAEDLKPGFQTPSRAYGVDYILDFPGVTREDL